MQPVANGEQGSYMPAAKALPAATGALRFTAEKFVADPFSCKPELACIDRRSSRFRDDGVVGSWTR